METGLRCDQCQWTEVDGLTVCAVCGRIEGDFGLQHNTAWHYQTVTMGMGEALFPVGGSIADRETSAGARGTLLSGQMRFQPSSPWGTATEAALKQHVNGVASALGMSRTVVNAAWNHARKVFRHQELSGRFRKRARLALDACLHIECGRQELPLEPRRLADACGIERDELLNAAVTIRRALGLEQHKPPAAAYLDRLIAVLVPAPPEGPNERCTNQRRRVKRLCNALLTLQTASAFHQPQLAAVGTAYWADCLRTRRASGASTLGLLCREVNVSEKQGATECAAVEELLLQKAKKTPWASDVDKDDLLLWGRDVLRYEERLDAF